MPRKVIDSGIKMANLREIKTLNLDEGRTPNDTPCPSCGGSMTRGPVPCPDGKPGCLVIHYGLRCSKCGKYWH